MKARDIPPFGLRLPPSLKEWVEQQSEKEERSQNWLLTKIVQEAKERHEQNKQA